MNKKNTKVLSGVLATTLGLGSVMGATTVLAKTVDELYSVAFTATQEAQNKKTQEAINVARKAVRELETALKDKKDLKDQLIGTLSGMLDPLQQQQFNDFYAIIYKEDHVTEKEKLTQDEINKARAYVESFRGAYVEGTKEYNEYIGAWSTAVDKFQGANIAHTDELVKKALDTKKAEDVTAAREALNDLLKSTNKDTKQHAEGLEAQLVKIEEALKEASLKEVKAIAANKIKVEFNAPVDTEKAKFEVKKSTVVSKVSKVTWNTEKTVATLEMGNKLFTGEYAVSVTGLTETALTSKITVENEKATTIEIMSDKAALVKDVTNNVISYDKVRVGYRVMNQYGEDITTKISLSPSVSQGVVNFRPSENIIEISGLAFPKIGDKISLTLVHAETATTASKVLTVDEASKIDSIELKGLYNADKKELTEDNRNNDFYVLFDAKDQYGNKITEKEAKNSLMVYVQNPLVANANVNDIKEITVDGKKQLALKLGTSNSKTGTTEVVFISLGTGKKESIAVEVSEGSTVHNFVLIQPEVVAKGEKVIIPFEAFAKNGNKVEKESLLKEVTLEVFGCGLSKNAVKWVKNSSGKLEIELDLTGSSVSIPQNGTGKVTITALTKTHQVSTMTLDVRQPRLPKTIESISVTPNVQIGSDFTIKAKHVLGKDQHGTDIKIKDYLGTSEGNYRVVIKNNSVAGSRATDFVENTIESSTGSVTIKGISKGSDVLNVKLQVMILGQWKDVEGSAINYTVRVAEKNEYESYVVDDIGTVYDDSTKLEEKESSIHDEGKYASWVGVYGVLPNGQKVELPGSDYSISSQTEGLIATVDGYGYRYVNAVCKMKDGKAESPFTYATGKTETTGKITVTINATGEQLNKDVTVSKAAPKVDSISLESKYVTTDNNGKKKANIKVTPADLFALVSSVEDNYYVGASIDNTGLVTFADGSKTTTTLLVTDYVKTTGSKAEVVNNGTKDMKINYAELGDQFILTINVGGVKQTLNVTVGDRQSSLKQIEAAKKAFDAEIANYKEADYSVGSWKTFKAFVDRERAEVNKADATVATINAATDAVKDAAKNLEPKGVADLADAKKAFNDEVAKYKEADYTADSWKGFDVIVKAQQDIVKNDKVTLAEVNGALTAVQDAAKKLVKVADAALAKAKEDFNKLVKEYNDKSADYTLKSWAEFAPIFKSQQDIANAEGATAETINKVINNIRNAASVLETIQ